MQTISHPPRGPLEELKDEILRLLSEGFVIWTRAEATVHNQNGGQSVVLLDDGFLGLASDGTELRVFRVQSEAGAISHTVSVLRDGWRTALSDRELGEIVFNKAAEKAL
jgi:hypothetical protein